MTLVPVMAAPAVPADVVLRPIGDLAPRRMVYAALPRTAPLPAAMALLAPLREEARRLTAPPASPGAAAG